MVSLRFCLCWRSCWPCLPGDGRGGWLVWVMRRDSSPTSRISLFIRRPSQLVRGSMPTGTTVSHMKRRKTGSIARAFRRWMLFILLRPTAVCGSTRDSSERRWGWGRADWEFFSIILQQTANTPAPRCMKGFPVPDMKTLSWKTSWTTLHSRPSTVCRSVRLMLVRSLGLPM